MSERLLIDAGNSRLKWRLEQGVECVEHGTITYAEDPDWAQRICPRGCPASIFVGSVAGPAVNDSLKQWAQQLGVAAPRFVHVVRECLGLRVAYRDTSRLGVDRFLAMLGARAQSKDAVCVADVGTALTLDAVDARGLHKGGLIAPGPVTMVNALLSGTARINDASIEPPDTPFARDTAPAVTGGACYAVAALIDRFATEAATTFGCDVTLLLAGGGRQRVAPLLRTIARDAPDLVFDGLRAVATGPRAVIGQTSDTTPR